MLVLILLGTTGDTGYDCVDADGDGYGVSNDPGLGIGCWGQPEDCDDSNPYKSPGNAIHCGDHLGCDDPNIIEFVCDCDMDGAVDDGLQDYDDQDSCVTDGTNWDSGCIPLTADELDCDGDGVLAGDDCDDLNHASTTPGNAEICDGLDNDCDQVVDEGCAGGDADTDADTDSDTDTDSDADADTDTDTDSDTDTDTDTDTDSDADADADVDPDLVDADGDGIASALEGSADPDGDGLPNYLDPDSDGDGIGDGSEFGEDADCDGVDDFIDTVDDNRCIVLTRTCSTGLDPGWAPRRR